MGNRMNQWRSIAVILAMLSGQSVAFGGRDSSDVKRILVFGDSLSAGFGLKSSQAWPWLLAEKLHTAGLTNFEITNASQNGGTTAGGLQRLGPHLKSEVDIFVLELGINDAFRGVPISQIRNNLQEIIDRVKQRSPNVHVVIAGMQLPNYSADDYVFAFGQIYADVAAKNNATLIPYLLKGVGGDPNLNQPDRVHPNAAGQKILAENVWKVLEPIAREVAGNKPSPAARAAPSP
jgi:acyl-CoA thioesterase I